MLIMEAIKRPLELQRFFFFFFWSAYLNNFNTICWCVRKKKKIVLNFVVKNNNLKTLFNIVEERFQKFLNFDVSAV